MGPSLHNKRKQLQALKLSETSRDIDEMIHLASIKLYPIIELVVDNAIKSEHFLTKQEFADATTAANIIKEICEVLVYADFKIRAKDVDFALDKHKAIPNNQGKIYVETGLLMQLIDLYNILEDAKDTVDEFYQSVGIHSFVQTDSSFSICSEESLNPNRIVLRLTKPSNKSTSSFGFLPRNFIIMPSTTNVNDELKESKSEISTSLEKSAKESSVKRVRSTGSIANEEVSEVTDVYGAKRVVVRCIYDLQEVGKYLGTERKDVATICSRAEVDGLPSSAKRKSNASDKSFHSAQNTFTEKKNSTLQKSDTSEKSNSDKTDTSTKRNSDAQKTDTSAKSNLSAQKTDTSVKSKSSAQKTDTSTKSNKDDNDKSSKSERTQPLIQTEGGDECCCPECFAELGSRADLKECDDDRVIICIKGCNEDDGDVQIVIRQCPDCKKAEETPKRLLDKSVPLDKGSSPDKFKSVPSKQSLKSVSSKQSIKSVPSKRSQNSLSPKQTQPIKKEQTTPIKKKSNHSNVESPSLHIKDSQGSYVCSEEEEDEEDERDRKSYLPITKASSNSIKGMESTFLDERESFQKTSAKGQKKLTDLTQSNTQQQSRVECSKIRMFETTNLCLETDTGQELVISVTVTPKEFGSQKLSLRDIFSEDSYGPVNDKIKLENPTIKTKRRLSVDSNSSKKSVSLREPDPADYYVEERVIPLGRTKICSSVDFDVTTIPTRIREKGIQHKNAQIVVKLKDLGIDNLLRACRPAKCCRKAVLNEKMKKCLPYPPSLKSLPLDDDDIEVINQSLQMSVQKVKNSTDLNKDFYANYSYSMKPIQTIWYFFVEHSNKNLNSINKKKDVREKLSYYINLVNDTEYGTESKFDILYFGVEEISNKNLPVEVKKNINNKYLVNAKKGDVISGTKAKYNKYENQPMFPGYNAQQNSSFFTKNLNFIRNQCGIETESKVINKKKAVVSRIPVYVGNNRTKYFSPESNYNVEEIEQEVYGISLDSLPSEAGLLQKYVSSASGPKSSSSSKYMLANTEKLGPQIDRIDQRGVCSKGPDTSKYSVLSTNVLRKTKRKKKAFYMSRSKSDISLKTIKNKCKHTATSTQTNYFSKELLKRHQNNQDKKSEISSTNSNVVKEPESSKMLLNYFSKMLYKMIVREALNENTFDNVIRNRKYQESRSKMTENKSLYELYKRFSSKNNELLKNFEIRRFDAESVHHDLKAKQSQSRIVISSRTSKKKVCIINNLAIQTSVLFDVDSKQCQTSNSLIAYLIKPKAKPEDTYIQKKRIFKKIYNGEALSGIPNSCDQLEKFIVVFRSDHSLKSNISDNTGFLSSASEHSDRSLEHFSEETISYSLLKLKETLEKYENMKNEIAQGSIQSAHINPIEYFVYQMCACNKFSKKPSVMQKILNKSKGLFTSIEKDLSHKYNNQREFLSMSPADRQRLCHQCGCFIPKCNGNIHADNKPSDTSFFCQCPPENKPKKAPPEPCCKHKKSSHYKNGNLSKLTNASMASVKSLRTYFKRSLSNIKSRSREKNEGPCVCDKYISTRKGIDDVCIPANINAVSCPKKDTSTFTTKDSTTQKCECSKCEHFADDGTCCCSHCLGCLDKSSDAKPDNNNIGTLCSCPEEAVSKDISTGKDDTKVDAASIKSGDKAKNSEDIKEVKRVSDSDKDKKAATNNKNGNKVNGTTSKNNSNTATVNTAVDRNDTIATSNSIETGSGSVSPVPADSSSENQPDNKVTNLETNNNNNERVDTNHDATSYYFLTSSPNLFSQFGVGSRNPFEQYLLNFPNINVLRVNNSETFLNE